MSIHAVGSKVFKVERKRASMISKLCVSGSWKNNKNGRFRVFEMNGELIHYEDKGCSEACNCDWPTKSQYANGSGNWSVDQV